MEEKCQTVKLKTLKYTTFITEKHSNIPFLYVILKPLPPVEAKCYICHKRQDSHQELYTFIQTNEVTRTVLLYLTPTIIQYGIPYCI